jgi:hypothetical protein
MHLRQILLPGKFKNVAEVVEERRCEGMKQAEQSEKSGVGAAIGFSEDTFCDAEDLEQDERRVLGGIIFVRDRTRKGFACIVL